VFLECGLAARFARLVPIRSLKVCADDRLTAHKELDIDWRGCHCGGRQKGGT
jgi:hypothetical protein